MREKVMMPLSWIFGGAAPLRVAAFNVPGILNSTQTPAKTESNNTSHVANANQRAAGSRALEKTTVAVITPAAVVMICLVESVKLSKEALRQSGRVGAGGSADGRV